MIKHKRVELTELFYDLVYVYAISQTTSLIEHLQNGIVSLHSIVVFFLAMIILLNTWMYQTVYINRYGKNSIANIIAMFIQMSFLLISSTVTSTADHWSESFVPFILSFVGVTAVQFWQYFYEYTHVRHLNDKRTTRSLMLILLFRLVALTAAVFMPSMSGMITAILAIIISWLLPFFTTYIQSGIITESVRITNFAHLAERLSLLVIIMFGEALIRIAPYFDMYRIGPPSFFMFWILANHFMIYIIEIDNMIDMRRRDSGVPMIYSHYFVFFGISFMTVSLSFFENPLANQIYIVSLFGLGELIYLTGIFLHRRYNKVSHYLPMRFVLTQYALALSGLMLALVFYDNVFFLTFSLFGSSLMMSAMFITFNIRQNKIRPFLKRLK